MTDPFSILWLIPLLPLGAAAITALLPRKRFRVASGLAIAAQGLAFILSLIVFRQVWQLSSAEEGLWRGTVSFNWLTAGEFTLPLGLLLDPLTAAMLVMVTSVSLLIFIFSLGYMGSDPNRTRFYCFLSLFSAGMLGIIVTNSLLLLFAAWEIVGLSSYLLIGFWFERPAAADAARKAFITTRIGDIGLLIGMVWLYAESGSLLFYDQGSGCLEASALASLAGSPAIAGIPVAAAIALLLFCGAAGKSGQFPFHVWLPDAMEGPTPVSALIHAATMVAAGVFLVARVFPLFEAGVGVDGQPVALTLVTWIGAITALLAAFIAVGQFDLKRILAYSTISQLGLMMVALGVGGWPAAILHLIAHAFFKGLLFLGAGSVLFGTHHVQDIRRLGGLRHRMPLTFATYAVGMMALAGFPFLFSGFWTKEAILHGAHEWPLSQVPFYAVLVCVFLTAFYMTRQTAAVFFGSWRGDSGQELPGESPSVMTLPLFLLAAATVLISLVLTPAWPWFHGFLTGTVPVWKPEALLTADGLGLMLGSILIVTAGVLAAWLLYIRRPRADANEADPLEDYQPAVFRWLGEGLYIDALYHRIFVRGTFGLGYLAAMVDQQVVGGVIRLITLAGKSLGKITDHGDRSFLNAGFNRACEGLRETGHKLARTHTGHTQIHLRFICFGVVFFLILHAWIS